MTKRLFILVCLALLTSVLAACGGGGSKSVPSDSVALVGRTAITKTQFNSLMDATAKVDKVNKQTPPKAGTTAYKQVQDRVIAFLVQLDELAQKGSNLGVNVTDQQVQTQIDKVKKQYFGGNEAKFEKGLAAQGLTLDIYQLEWRSQLLSQGIYTKVTKNVKVAPADGAVVLRHAQVVVHDRRVARRAPHPREQQDARRAARDAAQGRRRASRRSRRSTRRIRARRRSAAS